MEFEPENGSRQITIAEFIENAPGELEFEVIAGRNGLNSNSLSSERIQKLGLALSGYTSYLHSGRVQVIGQSEVSYFDQLQPSERAAAIEKLDPDYLSCLVVTKGLAAPGELIAYADLHNIPMLGTSLATSHVIRLTTTFLQSALAPALTIHGVLMEIFGSGVLLLGESGIGKSECALDLITRGHSLIADDSVKLMRIGPRLWGEAPQLIRELLEIRGLGIINVRSLFGVSAIGNGKTVDICIELKAWKDAGTTDRIGSTKLERDVFGVQLPTFVIPVTQGRNLAALVETAVRIYRLRASGADDNELVDRYDKVVAGRAAGTNK